MTDITAVFKDIVAKQRSARGLSTPAAELMKPVKKDVSEFTHTSRVTLKSIEEVYTSLLRNRRAYLSSTSGMTDSQRDELDSETRGSLKMIKDTIDVLKTTIEKASKHESPNVTAHRASMILSLNDKVAQINTVYDELRKERYSRALDDKDGILRSIPMQGQSAAAGMSLGNAAPKYGAIDTDLPSELSASEMKLLEEENDMLQNELNTMVDQVRQVEGRMVEISQLSHIFATKVLEQSQEIENIYNLAVQSTQNIEAGNKELDKAAKSGVGFRFMILFFLLFMSFALLVLDAYS
eukprot:GFYU01019645.1.p1 GENE.GFYU01019645.1~~GFYU01019645.1.p1  ORF type:complete len:295 (+),score=45.24 GFYU01019645.1:131-1015(+)